jgi:hypothetical protein
MQHSVCDDDLRGLCEVLSTHARQVRTFAVNTWEQTQDMDGERRVERLHLLVHSGGALLRQLQRMLRTAGQLGEKNYTNLEQLEAEAEAIEEVVAQASEALAACN